MERAQEILDASEDCENLTAADIIVHVSPHCTIRRTPFTSSSPALFGSPGGAL